MRGGLQVPCTVVVRETTGGGGDSKFGLREVGRTPLTATYEGREKRMAWQHTWHISALAAEDPGFAQQWLSPNRN